eukprot:CAMPEP_0206039854 /NCGR_PEP_ID=MMETSP1466-20131121/5023_1 /ASSEMBLY_ACC=CAM_ASM_001126 /TAXON_ID=44452 /ORGANISM="Pavlova gyrans, Strain CCMP608" /LENGTH=234 /DNA_ID=CAMNT_0053414509 /DNA_START=30 /DNA_END=733 /DNA_ORIENTATION=+
MFALARPALRSSVASGARQLSTTAAKPAPALFDAGTSAVVGACYAGAIVWVSRDGMFTKLFGGEKKQAEMTIAKDQVTRMEDDLSDIRKAVERGAMSKALEKKYKYDPRGPGKMCVTPTASHPAAAQDLTRRRGEGDVAAIVRPWHALQAMMQKERTIPLKAANRMKTLAWSRTMCFPQVARRHRPRRPADSRTDARRGVHYAARFPVGKCSSRPRSPAVLSLRGSAYRSPRAW